MLSLFCSVNLIAQSSYNPLVFAAENGDLNKVKELINSGTDINSRDEKGYTALRRASAEGYIEIVKFLISKGAYVNVRDDEKSLL